MKSGLITSIFDWGAHPSYSEGGSVSNWLAGLVLVLILAFLWSTVVKQFAK